jgi:GNAT superfamily N-acetyltransferase
MNTNTPEIEVTQPGELDAFWQRVDRDWRSELWEFRVVWHEQFHDLAIRENGAVVAALRLRIAASLAHVIALYVVPERRRAGLGRALATRAEEIANYFNCHKMTVEVFDGRAAQRFFERCGYKTEAVLPQHTFKLDVAVLRKFLL